MLPLANASLTGVFTCLARRVGGSDRTLGGAGDALTVVDAVALTAIRGVIGVRAVRVDESEGLSAGRAFLEVSEDIRR